MRAFTIYNDKGTIGISILATIPDDLDNWKKADLAFEDRIATMEDINLVAEEVSEFPRVFPDYSFHRAVVYGDMDKAKKDVEEGQSDFLFGVTNRIPNPPTIHVTFKEKT